MPSQGLSLQEFVELGAFVLALLSPLSVAMYRTRKKMYRIAADLEAARRETGQLQVRLQALSTSRARGLLATNTCLDALTGVLHRILLQRSNEVDIAAEIHQLRLTRRGVERAAAEARLFSGEDRIAERSALQQLTFQVGDVASAELFRALARMDGTRTLKPRDLEIAAVQLVTRLTERPP